jgi:hypothetical protein
MITPLARCRSHVLFQSLPEGGVLLDTRSETYFGLNPVGARICEMLPQHASLETLCDELATEYPDVPLKTLRSDVKELLADLVAEGLLEMPDAGSQGQDVTDVGIPAP